MNLRQLLPAALALVSAGAYAPTAHACGGFFCNASQPVNQAAERIIFSQNADGSTTAVIQIQYSGPSESFAWMLPVVGSPDISVSSNVAMAALQNVSNPQYTLTTVVEGECDDGGSNGFFRGSSADSAGAPSESPTSEDPEVTVVNSGSVGPYDFVIISVDNSAADVGLVATEWLQENEYDVSELGRDRLVPYLESGMNLLAFRLTKGRDAGAIRPVVLNFGEGLPSIPLRPTAAAATDDMGIMVFVVGESRAIPANYLDLELNEAAINWLQPNTNYGDVVTQAANEAGGQGFVTEFVGESERFEDVVYPEFIEGQWESLQELTGFQLVRQTASLFQGWDGFSDAILAEVTKPADVSEDDWNANPVNYIFSTSSDFSDVNSASFINRVQLEVIDPVLETAALFAGNRTVTRFFTTMSADEMTMDPVFDFNAELEQELTNLHTATRTIECSRGITQGDATWRVLFDNGVTVRGEANNWPLSDIDTLPAMRTSRRIGTVGEGEIITDNSAQIVSTVNESNRSHPRNYGNGLFAGGVCSVSSVGAAQGTGSLAMLLGLVGLVALRRRRNA
jgi:MYXO-CTERM domain-containing protein